MNILVFGGTSDGRILAQKLAASGFSVAVSVATAVGQEELACIPGVNVLCGRLTQQEMCAILPQYDLCVDATHPYSCDVSRNIKNACACTGTVLRRLLRAEESADISENCHVVASNAEAASFLSEKTGNILITTGSKELQQYAAVAPERLFPRILPTHDGLEKCESIGIPHKNIIAMQGPFSQKLNEAMIEQLHISWLVTRDSGKAGGFKEKISAAEATGAKVVLVCRPDEEGESMESILSSLGCGGQI